VSSVLSASLPIVWRSTFAIVPHSLLDYPEEGPEVHALTISPIKNYVVRLHY
jgi:hypothetical protein